MAGLNSPANDLGWKNVDYMYCISAVCSLHVAIRSAWFHLRRVMSNDSRLNAHEDLVTMAAPGLVADDYRMYWPKNKI